MVSREAYVVSQCAYAQWRGTRGRRWGHLHSCSGTRLDEERNIIVRTHESQSEVARLREQITLEDEAAQHGLSGPALTVSHQFMTTRLEGIGEHVQERVQLVGAEKACALVFGEAEGKLP
jgi:hypothetical protein